MNIWEIIGFTGNIYFVKPLEIGSEIEDLFVGRIAEVQELLVDCASDSRSLKLVTGDVGVGKTSFVNACQHFFYTGNPPKNLPRPAKKILPSFYRIELDDQETAKSFISKACHTLAKNLNAHYEYQKKPLPASLRPFVNYWLNTSIKTSDGGFGMGVFGAQISFQEPSYNLQEMRDPLFSLHFMLKEFSSLEQFQGIFLVVDNLDIVNFDVQINVFNSARDSLFFSEGFYWVMIGQKGLSSLIHSKSQRLSSLITGIELSLLPLSVQELEDLIEHRSKVFRITDPTMLRRRNEEVKESVDKKYRKDLNLTIRPPCSTSTLTEIYELTKMDLRETFRICEYITKKTYADEILFLEPVGIDIYKNYLIELIDNDFQKVIVSKQHIGVLSRLYREGKRVQSSDYAGYGYKSASGFSNTIRSLVKQRFLIPDESKDPIEYRASWRTEALAITGRFGVEAMDKIFR